MPSPTSSTERPAAWRTFPWALVLALVSYAASERVLWRWQPLLAFCARYAPPQLTAAPLRTEAQMAFLPRAEPWPPVLLIGSSQIQEGLECEAFEARFPGRKCLNLGFQGGTPLDMLFLADRIDRRTSRRVLVTGLFPQMVNFPPKATFSDRATLACLWRSGALARMSGEEWIDVLYGQTQNLSETLRMKDSIRGIWEIVGRDPMAAVRLEMPPQPLRIVDPKPPLDPDYFADAMDIVDPEIKPGKFTPAHEIALARLIEREGRRGNRVVIIDFPTRRGYETTITAAAILHHRHLLERLGAHREVVLVRRSDLPILEDSDFHDFTHLRRSGRQQVSARVAEILARAERGW